MFCTMCLENHITTVVASYLKPKLLAPFFVRNNLAFSLGFKYDAYNCEMTVRHLFRAIQYFPNIVLIGVNFELFGAKQLVDVSENLKGVRKVRLIGKEICMDVFNVCKITHLDLHLQDERFVLDLEPFDSLEVFKLFGDGCVTVHNISKCTKLKSVTIQDNVYECITDLGELESEEVRTIVVDRCVGWNRVVRLIKLRKLVVEVFDGYENLLGLEKCSRLHHVKMGGQTKICDIGVLGECVRLKKLDLESRVGFGGLSKLRNIGLRELKIRVCDHCVGGFERLRVLDMVCGGANVDFLVGCIGLRRIVLRECVNLVDLGGIHEGVEELELLRCEKIVDFSFLNKLWRLKKLMLEGCEIKNVGRLGIENLELVNCFNLESVEGMQRLKSIRLEGCKTLKCGGFTNIVGLETLCLKDCWGVEELYVCEGLKKVDICSCGGLRRIIGLEKCVDLENVRIKSCNRLGEVPDLSGCGKLREFNLIDCRVETVGLKGKGKGWGGLEKLDLKYCFDIKSIDDLDLCFSLKFVSFVDLNIMCLPDFGNNVLERIDLCNCKYLRDISGLKKCRYLEKIRLISCILIEDLHCLHQCANLEIVQVLGRPRQLVEEPTFCISDECVIEVEEGGFDWSGEYMNNLGVF